MNGTDIQDPFLTVAEVAGLLKLNQQTVRNWIDQGSLPAVRVGRRVRIRRSDLERVLADGYSGSGTGGASRQAAAGPSAEDFWGGEAVGTAEPPPPTHDPLDVATRPPPTHDPLDVATRPPPTHDPLDVATRPPTHDPLDVASPPIEDESEGEPSDGHSPADPMVHRDDDRR